MKAIALMATLAGAAAVLDAGDVRADDKKSARVLRHVVMFKFKDAASKQQIAKVVSEFAALPKKIDAIAGFEMGTDVSVEKLSKGFTHCFVVTFRTAKARDVYLPHPAHKEFVKLVKPLVDDVLVVDYWTAH